MDKLEVMLRFGNALLRSPVGSEISPDVAHSAASLNQNRRRKKTERKEEQHPSSSSYRRDFFGYYMSLMRAHTHEQGDDLPSIDSSPFRHMAMLAEAYLFHINVAEIIDKKLKVLSNNDEVVETVSLNVVTHAYSSRPRLEYKRNRRTSFAKGDPSILQALKFYQLPLHHKRRVSKCFQIQFYRNRSSGNSFKLVEGILSFRH